jgi:hypothetical protein
MPTSEWFLMARSGEPRTRHSLLLESIALRHQIAVVERSRTRRPASAALIACFGYCYRTCAKAW